LLCYGETSRARRFWCANERRAEDCPPYPKFERETVRHFIQDRTPQRGVPTPPLRAGAKRLYSSSMKLALAALVYSLIALILSVGILLLITGKPWLLIIALVAYVVAFAKIGCLSQH